MLLEGLASIVLAPEHTLRAAMGDMVAGDSVTDMFKICTASTSCWVI
jgi:hypothetical protein